MNVVFYGNNPKLWIDAVSRTEVKDKLSDIVESIKVCEKYDEEELKDKNYIIPLMTEHMIELHKNNIKAIMPDLYSIETFACKKLFSEYVRKHNLEKYTPKVYYRHEDIGTKLFIVKAYNRSAGVGQYITVCPKKEEYEKKVVQEYIHNRYEYTTNAIVLNGEIKYNLSYKHIFDNNCHIKGTDHKPTQTVRCEIEKKHIDILEQFLLPCSYNGICNIDYIIRNDEIKVFEINPRFGGTIMFEDRTLDLIDFMRNLFTFYK